MLVKVIFAKYQEKTAKMSYYTAEQDIPIVKKVMKYGDILVQVTYYIVHPMT